MPRQESWEQPGLPYRRDDWRRGEDRDRDRGAGLLEREDRGPIQRLGEAVARKLGRGPKGYRRPDDRIHDEVCERIARSGIDAREVEVRVVSAEVTLEGTVASRGEKRWLEDLADDVFGVEEVHNHLRTSRDR